VNAPALAPGTSVGGRWQVAAFIGRGELGEVYAVRDPLSGQPGALKRFAPALLDHADAWAAFDKAAQAVAALPFDGFAKRIDSGKDTAPWVVTDRVVWPSLADQIRAGGALPIERLAAMLEALAPALDAAHAAGLVHRDLKPGNVFVEPAEKPTVHITDFGVWRLRVALGLAPGWAATPGWLGPDAADPAEASTPRMDVFALGLVVFHALTGHSRFRAVEREPLDTAALWTQMLEPIGSASALAAELGAPLDAALDDWFSQALAPRPEQRFESVGTMAGNFRAAVQSIGGASSKPPARPGPALERQLGPSVPPPTGTKPAREPPPPSSDPQHEPVAMVSAQPLAYLRVPTRPPPADTAAAPPTPVAINPPTPTAPLSVPAPTPPPAPARPPVAEAAPVDVAPAAHGLPKKRGLTVPLAIAGGVLALGGLGLLVSHLVGSPAPAESEKPAASAPATPSALAAASNPAPPASAAPPAASASAAAEPAPPKQAAVRFECEPACDRIECDGRQVELDAGSAALDPGPHRCTATRRGYLPANDRFDLEPGQDASRHLTLTKLRPARPAAPPHAPAKKKKPCGTFINPCK
jgi:serine/threonine-protein kinase